MSLNMPPELPDALEPCCNVPVRQEWIERRWSLNGLTHNLIQQVEYYCSACDRRLYILQQEEGK